MITRGAAPAPAPAPARRAVKYRRVTRRISRSRRLQPPARVPRGRYPKDYRTTITTTTTTTTTYRRRIIIIRVTFSFHRLFFLLISFLFLSDSFHPINPIVYYRRHLYNDYDCPGTPRPPGGPVTSVVG